ncbi:MAG: Nif3-like dinuclear metal center hexameric protein [Tropheryma whipplei]|uniref:Nif3-like dinuclear metal center hexameric protein n=1 Tax=Tropheryma whipplei TaxID=2039 RepID=UPI001EEE82DC|nr:Nif3-like dinuclear metal center hexameric protein [Tropheryma whipplei]MCO8190248.1 Nif3-like dinuclear metal center hexameric protein [Tropheryma whipplei]
MKLARSLDVLCATFESMWPSSDACEWDNVGLLCGFPGLSVERVHFVVDVTSATINEAIKAGADLLVSHHPLIFKPIKKLTCDTYESFLLSQLIESKCALFSVHTNADIAPDGLAQHWSHLIGLRNVKPVRYCPESPSVDSTETQYGFGRIGDLAEPVSLYDFAKDLKAFLPETVGGIMVAGDEAKEIHSAAVVPGAGDDFLDLVLDLPADVYVTSDLRHHPAVGFREKGILIRKNTALICVSHWASEWLWLGYAAELIKKRFPDLSIEVSSLRTDPWDFRV